MDIMDWCVETVVPSFKESGMVPRPKRRAAEGEGCPDHKGVLAYEVVDKVMTLLGDMIMVGLTGIAMEMKIATFTDVVGTGIVWVCVCTCEYFMFGRMRSFPLAVTNPPLPIQGMTSVMHACDHVMGIRIM